MKHIVAIAFALIAAWAVPQAAMAHERGWQSTDEGIFHIFVTNSNYLDSGRYSYLVYNTTDEWCTWQADLSDGSQTEIVLIAPNDRVEMFNPVGKYFDDWGGYCDDEKEGLLDLAEEDQ